MRRLTPKLAGGAVVTVMSLLINMTPASAAGVGVTTGGFSTISAEGEGLPTCIQTNADPRITLSNAGTVTVGTQVYTGASTAEFTLDGPFYFNPAATYGADSSCLVPGTTPLTGTLKKAVTVPPTPALGSLSCTFSSGSYARVTEVYTITASGTCTINNVTASATFVFTGNQNPCLPVGNCEGALANTEFGPGTYVQA